MLNNYFKKSFKLEGKDKCLVNVKSFYISFVFTSTIPLLYSPPPTVISLFNLALCISVLGLTFIFVFWSLFYVQSKDLIEYPGIMSEVNAKIPFYSWGWILINDLRNIMVATVILFLPSNVLLGLILLVEVLNLVNFFKAQAEKNIVSKNIKVIEKACFLTLIIILLIISTFSKK